MNALTQYFVPEWVSMAFLLLIPLPFVLIAWLVRRQAERTQHKTAFAWTVAFFTAYLAYISWASLSGLFNQVLFPPKVLLMTTFPYAFFLFVVVAKTRVFNNLLAHTTVEQLVGLHIFRVVGGFFVVLALYDALPKPFAFIAGFGDVLTALSSIYVVKVIRDKKAYAKKLAYAWNIFGTADILFTAIAANVLTKISIDTGAMGVDTLAFFPFSIIPAFAPPTILFIHWMIFKKLNQVST